ncbi:hypothetical protein Tel_07835 [Candidatus Tenderia electrophaga]|jgi:protein-S-isoprenylcysteine O-methyltransferase Ste14|uniref:Uncharacterized protein n=1 Tax=Candidatus Tenderia electrophaga TaxID=1748243 RepID=A0A0S2TD44_9GAMM|nr:hypothetical protein Tel_07835 [Candidatus Tenderia electrophaga]
MSGAEPLLVLIWSGYFVLHSLLASHGFKRYILAKLPRLTPCYRLAYNLVALLTLVPIAWIHLTYPAATVWQWQGVAAVLTDALALAALLGFAWSLKYYDMAAFTGVRACLRRDVRMTQERLTLSPLHRWVRHPWYLFAIVMVWSRDQNTLSLISTIMVTLYFFIGAKLEERKLRREFGAAYAEYMQRVPGIIPLPWRRLSAAEAERISRRSRPVAGPDRRFD